MSGLTAWERWELASFDDPHAPGRPSAARSAAESADRLPTVEEVEQIRAQAQQQGYQAGHAEGQARARDEALRLAAVADRLDEAFKNLEGQVAEDLLALATEIARQVVRRELAVQPEALLDVIREALGQLPHQHAAIYLNPEDASLARSYLGDQLAHAGHRVLEDAKLMRGDCVLEAGGSHIDATVATRWRRTLEGLDIDSAWPAAEEK